MNRIREVNGKYQVLHTPNFGVAPTMEIIAGNWEDSHLRGFKIEEYPTLSDAQMAAFRMPDLDWYELVRMNVDHFHQLHRIIKQDLQDHKFIVDIKPNLMDPATLKDTTFRRATKLGERFTLTYDMNDIISFCIVNPWSKNLNEIAKVLKYDPRLRIRHIKSYDKMIHLIGTTELGTMFEIKLWPTIMYQWALRNHRHYDDSGLDDTPKKFYQDCLKLQDKIDMDVRVR